jgi:hypothetical protein
VQVVLVLSVSIIREYCAMYRFSLGNLYDKDTCCTVRTYFSYDISLSSVYALLNKHFSGVYPIKVWSLRTKILNDSEWIQT